MELNQEWLAKARSRQMDFLDAGSQYALTAAIETYLAEMLKPGQMMTMEPLEADLQAQERLGPTRQAQSGYKRPVFLHRLVGAGTIEETVVKRLKTKASVQDALMEAMKDREETL